MSKAKSMGKKILLQAYNTFAGGLLKPFSSEQEAKEWLIK